MSIDNNKLLLHRVMILYDTYYIIYTASNCVVVNLFYSMPSVSNYNFEKPIKINTNLI